MTSLAQLPSTDIATLPGEGRDSGEVLGRITDIGGSRMRVTGLSGTPEQVSTGIGALVKVSPHGEVVGIVDAMSFDTASPPRSVLCVNLVGEIAQAADRSLFFRRGVAHSPALGATVRAATKADLAADYADPSESRSWITVDTPVPFLIHELRRHLRESVGLASKPEAAGPHLRLLSRLESLIEDRRYSFMFGNSFDITDTLSELVGRLLRIPVAGKPITILALSGVPSKIADVMVSVTENTV